MRNLSKTLKKVLPLSLAVPVTLNWLIYMRKKKIFTGHKKVLEDKVYALRRELKELEKLSLGFTEELQEPVRKIKNLNHLLREKREELSPEILDYVARMSSCIEKIEERIASFHHFLHIEKENLNLEEINLKHHLTKVLEQFEKTIWETKSIIEIAPLPIVMADPKQLMHLFSHILSNAFKYRKEGVQNRILIYSEQEDGVCKIIFQDNGRGISQEESEYLFHPFSKKDQECPSKGAGLGLFLCKKIAEQHKGNIQIETSQKLGTIVIITLPLAAQGSSHYGVAESAQNCSVSLKRKPRG